MNKIAYICLRCKKKTLWRGSTCRLKCRHCGSRNMMTEKGYNIYTAKTKTPNI